MAPMTSADPNAPPSPSRFSPADRRFLAVCLAVLVAGGAIGLWGFPKAFPEASIDFKVTREEARAIAARELSARGFDVKGFRELVVFDHDDEAKVYLERTLGLSKANPLFGKTVPVWRWAVRFVKPLDRLEYVAYVAPTGELIAWRRILPEKDAAPDPGDAEAQRLAEEAVRQMRGVDPANPAEAVPIEATSTTRPGRVDRTFVWESATVRFGDGALRWLVEVQGDRVGRSTVFLKVPEKWSEEYRILRSKNEAAGAVATFGLFLTAVAAVVVFVERARRRDVKWRWAIAFGGIGTLLQFGSALNELPIRLYGYDTAEGWGGTVAKALLADFGGAVLVGVILVLLVAAGEPLYREAYPGKVALGRIFSRRGVGSRRFFRGLLLGYALTAFFFAYQVLFYLGAERMGAWAPADVPYSNLLGTSFPWLAVLLMGFLPATTEEFASRMLSIPLFSKVVPVGVAVVAQAAIWGFAHAAYPNQPFFIRGVEVGIAGVIVGVVMLKADLFPLLVWHFTVDAVYTSLILVRSSNAYFVVSGALAAGALLLPLVAAVVLYLSRGGFTSDEELTNAAVGSAPKPERVAEPVPETFSPARLLPLKPLAVAAAVGAAGIVLSFLLLPRHDPGVKARLALSRAAATRAADAFLASRGESPRSYVSAAYHQAALPALTDASDTGAGLIPYDWSEDAARWLLEKGGMPLLDRWSTEVLPGPVWQVRYVRFGERRGWWVVVDGRSGKVVGYRQTLPEEEAGASLDDAAALTVAKKAVSGAGLDPSRLNVVSAKAESRKARKDHRVVFESPDDAAGEARRRVTVEVAGDRPVLVATGLKVPEEWARAREPWRPSTYAATGWKVIGIGTLIGLLVVEVVRSARAGRVPWKRAARLSAWLMLPFLLEAVVTAPLVLRAVDPSFLSLTTFAVTMSVGLLVRLVLVYGLMLVGTGLVLSVRPDLLVAFRRGAADGRRSLAAAAAVALLVFVGRSLSGNLSAAWPLWAGADPLPAPAGIDTLLASVTVLTAGLQAALLLGALAALWTLLTRGILASVPAKAVALVAAAGILVPLGPRSLPEMSLPFLAALLPAAAFVVGAAVFLADDPRAYLLAGALVVLVRRGADLLESGVSPWMIEGAVLILVVAAAVAWWGFDRRAGEAR